MPNESNLHISDRTRRSLEGGSTPKSKGGTRKKGTMRGEHIFHAGNRTLVAEDFSDTTGSGFRYWDQASPKKKRKVYTVRDGKRIRLEDMTVPSGFKSVEDSALLKGLKAVFKRFSS